MADKAAFELVQDLVDIHCRTRVRFQHRQELLQEQNEDDRKFSKAASLLKPMLAKLDGPVHYQRGWGNHYAIRFDNDTKLVVVEPMSNFLDLELEDDRLISNDCLASIEKDLIECSSEDKSSDGEWKIGKQIIVPESVYKELNIDAK